MEPPVNPVRLACDAVGSPAELARRLKVSPPMIRQWALGFDETTGRLRDLATLRADSPWRPIPEKRCPVIEQVADGKVRAEQLRPDVCWVRIPDPDWPGASGRPCIDVMGLPAAERHAA